MNAFWSYFTWGVIVVGSVRICVKLLTTCKRERERERWSTTVLHNYGNLEKERLDPNLFLSVSEVQLDRFYYYTLKEAKKLCDMIFFAFHEKIKNLWCIIIQNLHILQLLHSYAYYSKR